LVCPFLAGVVALAPPVSAQTPPPSSDLQIRLAVQAAPVMLREGATVQGYDASGMLITLRRGTNSLICLAPDPRRQQLEVSCHHEGLEPFLARGRELAAQGVTAEQRTRARWEEIAAGTLPLPHGAVNHILTGSGVDSATAEIRDPFLRWVVYMPGATAASTGLSEQPAGPGQPWLMFAGTPGAHIMITPPRGR
jgi:hypothetical protein